MSKSADNPKTPAAIVKALRALPMNKVKVAIADIDGVLRGKYLHKDKFLAAIDGGFGFCNVVFGWDSSDVCYDNAAYTGWHTGYPDASAIKGVRVQWHYLKTIPPTPAS